MDLDNHVRLVQEQLLCILYNEPDRFKMASYMIKLYTPLWKEEEAYNLPFSEITPKWILLYKVLYHIDNTLVVLFFKWIWSYIKNCIKMALPRTVL